MKGVMKSNLFISEEELNFSGLFVPRAQVQYEIEVEQQFATTEAYQGKQMLQTCLEELDSYSKILNLVLRYPKLDVEWLPEKQVSQWLFSIQMPNEVIDVFLRNQIDGYALLELTKEDLEDMFEVNQDDSDHYSNEGDNTASTPVREDQIVSRDEKDAPKKKQYNNLYISKLLIQIRKLRIIWYKALKKLKLLDDYRDVLNELGIISQVEEEKLRLEEDNEEFFTQDADLARGQSMRIENRSGFFLNKLAEKNKLLNHTVTSQGCRSERDYDSDTGNSLMQYMVESKKEIIMGKNKTATKIKRNKSHL